MNRELWTSTLAEEDLTEAFEWYERRNAGLGTEFIKCVDVTVLLIQRSPLVFRKRVGEYRLAMTPRFPYTVYFIYDETRDLVSIRRVLRFSQDHAVQMKKA